MDRRDLHRKGEGVSRRVILLSGLLLAAGAARARADATVGTGTPASCNEAALNAAVNTVVPNGGVIRFNCGGAATINISGQKLFFWPDNPNLVYGVDGGGLITINAQGLSRHILHLSGTLNIVNITFTGGRAALPLARIGAGGAVRVRRTWRVSGSVARTRWRSARAVRVMAGFLSGTMLSRARDSSSVVMRLRFGRGWPPPISDAKVYQYFVHLSSIPDI